MRGGDASSGDAAFAWGIGSCRPDRGAKTEGWSGGSAPWPSGLAWVTAERRGEDCREGRAVAPARSAANAVCGAACVPLSSVTKSAGVSMLRGSASFGAAFSSGSPSIVGANSAASSFVNDELSLTGSAPWTDSPAPTDFPACCVLAAVGLREVPDTRNGSS
jgi:hypothetical protein